MKGKPTPKTEARKLKKWSVKAKPTLAAHGTFLLAKNWSGLHGSTWPAELEPSKEAIVRPCGRWPRYSLAAARQFAMRLLPTRQLGLHMAMPVRHFNLVHVRSAA